MEAKSDRGGCFSHLRNTILHLIFKQVGFWYSKHGIYIYALWSSFYRLINTIQKVFILWLLTNRWLYSKHLLLGCFHCIAVQPHGRSLGSYSQTVDPIHSTIFTSGMRTITDWGSKCYGNICGSTARGPPLRNNLQRHNFEFHFIFLKRFTWNW